MIMLTRLNGAKFYLNADFILTAEQTPDTVITLTDRTKLIVLETVEEVAERFTVYQRKVKNTPWNQAQENSQQTVEE